ncbi:hypothetical protein C5S53_03365 [Methanophagales archaeon]|jgi:hypothetical protein|nr:hypothetical protein C5S53_03365 [Methanophagales archaeon]
MYHILSKSSSKANAFLIQNFSIMVKLGSEVALSVLRLKGLNRGTLRKLIKLAGLTVDEFIETE